LGQAAGRGSDRDVHDGYLAARAIGRHVWIGSLWALGIGARISGDFFGGRFGLANGGFEACSSRPGS